MNKRGSLRASDAERDQIVDRLHKAATEGRIAAEELEQRVSQALRARTYAELEAPVADLPTPRDLPRDGQRRGQTAGRVAIATMRRHPLLIVLAIPLVLFTMAVVVAATVLWLVVMLVVFMTGGRRLSRRTPWAANRGRPYTRAGRRYGPPGPGGPRRSYWA